jgi:hypothetical protein
MAPTALTAAPATAPVLMSSATTAAALSASAAATLDSNGGVQSTDDGVVDFAVGTCRVLDLAADGKVRRNIVRLSLDLALRCGMAEVAENSCVFSKSPWASSLILLLGEIRREKLLSQWDLS